MHNVYLFQPQYAVEFRNDLNYWIPYSAGCLWSYAEQFDFVKENFTLGNLFFKRQDPSEILAKLDNPRICGFSCYSWNEKYCLEVARQIKQQWPNCITVFGGPNVNSKTLNHTFVDSVVLAEGELNFVEILRAVHQGNLPARLYTKSRLTDLDIPSPYLTGVFDQIIQDNPEVLWAITLETNRGCPYQCTFCDWGSSIYSKIRKFSIDRVRAELDWVSKNKVAYIFCADSNFGVFKDRDLEIAQMMRDVADQSPYLDRVNLTFAKNSTEHIYKIAQVLKNLSKGLTFSVQSMNDDTLTAIKRKNMDINNIAQLLSLSHEYKVDTYTEVILGLPEETLESWKDGMANILEIGQHDSIETWFCQLLENSELNSFESKLKYGIKSITAYDYNPQYNKDDFTDILEEIQIINQTNTMSTEDMIEAYIYSWLIIQLHIIGYTQIYAKFSRNILGVSYRQFYDLLFKEIKQYQPFKEHYTKFANNVREFLTTGKITDIGVTGHILGYTSFQYFYEHKEHIFKLGKQIVSTFTDDTDAVDLLQQYFIYDENLNLPKTITSDWDLTSWVPSPTSYTVSTKMLIDQKFEFARARRDGALKNIFTKID